MADKTPTTDGVWEIKPYQVSPFGNWYFEATNGVDEVHTSPFTDHRATGTEKAARRQAKRAIRRFVKGEPPFTGVRDSRITRFTP